VIQKLVYIGDGCYLPSGTRMSSIYHEDGRRCDYGFMQCMLKNGDEIHIRQATDDELLVYQQELDCIVQSRSCEPDCG